MAGWVGRRCPVCHRTVKATELRGVPSQAVPGGTWYLHKTPRSEHAIVAPTVQNSDGRPTAAPSRRDRRVSNRRPSRKGIGGRPLAFIPTLVVEHAAMLFSRHRRWTAVLEELERGGNGTYARNTLIRRVTTYFSGQNSGELERGRGRRRAARALSETRGGE